MKVQVKRLSDTAKIPVFAHHDDAGLDLFVSEVVTLEAGERRQIKTGIALAIPVGYVGLIWDKSGISHTFGMKVLGGVIDSGYRGEIIVGMVNLSTTAHTFAIGDKITQILIQRVEHADIEVVEELGSTLRGEQGFGSTGI